jgi:16S rRNA (guanine1207-N2)-methyltransferase
MHRPESQLLSRNASILPGGRWLLINPPVDGVLHELSGDRELHAFTQDHADWRALRAQRVDCAFGAAPEDDTRYDQVLLLHPKERALAGMLLFMARAHLAAGGSLWLAGENKGGIRATEKRLKDAGIGVHKVDAARHCQLLRVTPKSAGEAFRLDDWLAINAFELPDGRELAVASLPGVFSAGRLDDGTALLLSTLADISGGKVLDMGCGAGVIGASIAQRSPAAKVDMVDCSALALRASEETLRANGLAASVYASDGFSQVSGSFDWIVSNPPFHEGLATDYRFVETFIAEAKRYLRPNGHLRLVANAHLRYQPLIEQAFGNCRTLAENPRFRVYDAVRR